MKSIGQAQREIVESVDPLAAERVALPRALGRYLATPVLAARELPGFDHSAMDGYAVRHAELSAGLLRVHGESRAGGPAPDALPPASAMRIFTGALVPPGADTVVIQEDVERDGDAMRARVLPEPLSNIRKRGSDLPAGALAVDAGVRLGAGDIALLAALGEAEVAVHRAARVAIVCTGDELRELGEPLDAGALVNSNGLMLTAQLEQAGATPLPTLRASDTLDAIAGQLAAALAHADVVLATGGVSVGDHDLVAQALPHVGIEPRFWKVAMKPGKPLLFGMRAATPFIGLPGNPVSAFVGFELFVRPLLARLQGASAPYPQLERVLLSQPYRRSTGRPELARARLERSENGVVLAHLHARQGSGSLPGLAGCDALVLLPASAGELAAHTPLQALRIAAPATSTTPPFA